MAPPGAHSEIQRVEQAKPAIDKAAPTPLERQGVNALTSPQDNTSLINAQKSATDSAQSLVNGHFGTPIIEGSLSSLKSNRKSENQLKLSKESNDHAITTIGQNEKLSLSAKTDAKAESTNKSLTKQEQSKHSRTEAKADNKRDAKREPKSEARHEAKHESGQETKHETRHEHKHEAIHENKSESKPETKQESKAEIKQENRSEKRSETKQEAIQESRFEVNHESKSEAKHETKHEDKLEPKHETKAESKAESKSESKTDIKQETKSEIKRESNSEKGQESKPETKTPIKAEVTAESKPDVRPETKSEAKQESKSEIVLNNSEGKEAGKAESSQLEKTGDQKQNILNVNGEPKTTAKGEQDSLGVKGESRFANDQEKSNSNSPVRIDAEDDRETIHEQQARLNDLNHQGNASGAVAAETTQSSANFSPAVNMTDLGRSNSSSSALETTIIHSASHIINSHISRTTDETRPGLRIEEPNLQNNNSSQLTIAQSSTHTTSTGHTASTHSGTNGHSGTAHGAGKNGHDPSSAGHGSGHGHNQTGHSHDPASTGHSVNGQDPANNPTTAHDPSATDPSKADPSQNVNANATGQGGLNDPKVNQSGNNTNDPHGQSHDPQGNNVAASTLTGSCDPMTGHENAGAPGVLNNVVNAMHPGSPCDVPLPVYEEKPMRNLVTLIAEMGAALGPLHGIWSPWGETISGHNNIMPSIFHNANIVDSVSVSSTQSTLIETNTSLTNNQNLTYPPTPDVISTQVSQASIANDFAGVSQSSSEQIPLVQVISDGTYVPNGQSASLDTAHILTGNSSSAAGTISDGMTANGSTLGLPSDAIPNANVPIVNSVWQDGSAAINQTLNGIVDYWTNNPANSPQQNPVLSVNNSDPVPTDNLISYNNQDYLPEHDQLVSAAQHYHSMSENVDSTSSDKHDGRLEISNAWSSDSVQVHDNVQTSDSWQQNELQNRLDYLANGLWQEPDRKNNANSHTSGDRKSGRRKAKVNSDNFLTQLITLLNDSKSNSTSKGTRTYVVKQGDTLDSIAIAIYLDSRLGVLLYAINAKLFPNLSSSDWQRVKLIEGTILHLPEDGEVDRFKLAASRSEKKGRTANYSEQFLQGAQERRQNVERLLGSLNSQAESKYDAETGRAKVVVRFGDTIRSISLKHPSLNDVSLWKLLANCNGLSTEVDAKGAPLSLLTRGMVLQIPTEQEITEFRIAQAERTRANSPRKAIAAEVLNIDD